MSKKTGVADLNHLECNEELREILKTKATELCDSVEQAINTDEIAIVITQSNGKIYKLTSEKIIEKPDEPPPPRKKRDWKTRLLRLGLTEGANTKLGIDKKQLDIGECVVKHLERVNNVCPLSSLEPSGQESVIDFVLKHNFLHVSTALQYAIGSGVINPEYCELWYQDIYEMVTMVLAWLEAGVPSCQLSVEQLNSLLTILRELVNTAQRLTPNNS